jgi:hypothetical protein
VTGDSSTTDAAAAASRELRDTLEGIDNPIERLKLLSGDDEEITRYLDAIEVTSPREREMLREIARTGTLARLDLFPQAHRNMIEALESLARHGYHGTRAASHMGVLGPVIRWAVQLVARYVVVSYVRTVSVRMRNLYILREAEAVPGSDDRLELSRARRDGDRMVEALETREIGVPTFLVAGALVPLVAATGRATGLLTSTVWGTVVGIAGMLVALGASWVILRGTALASRRIRLATAAPARALWNAIGWCGSPPRDQTRTFVFVSLGLTIGAWIIVPVVVAIALTT